jgi:hypothetical protein
MSPETVPELCADALLPDTAARSIANAHKWKDFLIETFLQ